MTRRRMADVIPLEGEHGLLVEFEYYSGFPGTRFDPPEDAEIEIKSATLAGTNVLPLIEKFDLWEALTDELFDRLAGTAGEEPDEIGDPSGDYLELGAIDDDPR